MNKVFLPLLVYLDSFCGVARGRFSACDSRRRFCAGFRLANDRCRDYCDRVYSRSVKRSLLFSHPRGSGGYPFRIPRDHAAECDEIPAVPRGGPLIPTASDRDRSILERNHGLPLCFDADGISSPCLISRDLTPCTRVVGKYGRIKRESPH